MIDINYLHYGHVYLVQYDFNNLTKYCVIKIICHDNEKKYHTYHFFEDSFLRRHDSKLLPCKDMFRDCGNVIVTDITKSYDEIMDSFLEGFMIC